MKKYMMIWLLFSVVVSAQNRQIVEAAAGEDLSQKVSTQFQFLFPEFTIGDVFYKGHKGSGMLNYNMLHGEMQFMENKQVMALDNIKDVVAIHINNRKFYPFNEKEFTEELLSAGQYQLRVRRRGNVAKYSKKGAYGIDSSTSAITSYSSFQIDSRHYDMTVNEKVLVSLNYFYYLVGANGKHTLIKNVKSFTKQFPAHRTQIEDFVKERHIRFDSEENLKALLEYCSSPN